MPKLVNSVFAVTIVPLKKVATVAGGGLEDIRAMRIAFMTQAQQSQPQNLAQRYSTAIQAGKGFQEGPDGGVGGSGPGSSGSGIRRSTGAYLLSRTLCLWVSTVANTDSRVMRYDCNDQIIRVSSEIRKVGLGRHTKSTARP